MSDEIRTYMHDLSNKLLILDAKVKKAHKLCQQEDVKVELEKAVANSILVLDIFIKLKEVLNQK